jgi:hypothetical protein
MDKQTSANTLIARLGGTTSAAKYFEIEPPSVSEWRDNGIPKARMQLLRVAHPEWFDKTGVPIPLPRYVAAP